MFKKLVHKVCTTKECEKYNVPQEPGLYLCECCQSELQPVYVWNKQALAVVGILTGIVLALAGCFGYEYATNRLLPMEAMRILAGLDKLGKMQSTGRTIGGKIVVADGIVRYTTSKDFAQRPFIQRKEGKSLIFRHRHEYVNGEEFRWELITNLKHVYFFADRPKEATPLTRKAGDGGVLMSAQAPEANDDYYKMDYNPGLEKFVAVYSDKPLDALESQQPIDASRFGNILNDLERDPEVVVYRIELPHVKA